MNASVNQTTLLPCQADGVPQPLVSWLKDGVPLDPGSTRWVLAREGLGEGLRYLSAGCIWKPTWAVGAERTWVFSEPKGRFSGPENPCLSVSGFDSCLLICVSVCRFQASLSLRSIFYTFFLCEQVRDAPPPASHTAQVITPPFTQVAEPGELSVNPSSKFPGQRIPLAQPAGRVCPPSNRLWPWVGSQSTDMAPGKGQLLDLI